MTQRLRSTVMVLLGVTVSAVAVPAQTTAAPEAQPAVRRSPVLGAYEDPTMLLRLPQVQEELELSDQQKTKLKELEEEARRQTREQWSGLRDLSPDQRRAKYAELRQKMAERVEVARSKVEAVLLPHQQKRLRQIGIQLRMRWRGVSGIVGDAELARQLELTAQQREQLQKIAEETRQRLRDLPRQIMDDGKQKAMEVLTPQQRKKLEETVGKKFDLRWSRPEARSSGGASKVRETEKN